MDRDQLRRDFVTVDRSDEAVVVRVRQIEWSGPHDPYITFHQELCDAEITDAEIEALIERLLADDRFFGKCEECSEWNPRGWMHGQNLCQSCAQRNHGVVY